MYFSTIAKGLKVSQLLLSLLGNGDDLAEEVVWHTHDTVHMGTKGPIFVWYKNSDIQNLGKALTCFNPIILIPKWFIVVPLSTISKYFHEKNL